MIGTSEIIVIALVAFVLLFGAGKVPEGKSKEELKEEVKAKLKSSRAH